MLRRFTENLARRFNDPYFTDRFVEPPHLSILGLGARLFGGLKAKIAFDLIPKQSYAFCMMRAAELARDEGAKEVIAVEFGVAAGRGLMNLADLAKKIERETGVAFRVFGIDGGKGMPPPRDYRDHPDLYFTGDFPMFDIEALKTALPTNAELLVGEIESGIARVLEVADASRPIGFVSLDLDYFYSTQEALRLFDGDPQAYLPSTLLYFDDILMWFHNRWQGELLAIEEFNAAHPMRKIEDAYFIKSSRLRRNAHWLDQIFVLHVLDHPVRHHPRKVVRRILENPELPTRT